LQSVVGTGAIVRKFRDLGVEHMACTAVEKDNGNLQVELIYIYDLS